MLSKPVKNTNNQKIWVITERYYPEVVSIGQYLAEVGHEISNRFDVNVICGQWNDLSNDVRGPRPGNGVEVFPVWSTELNCNFVWYRMVNMFTLELAIFWNSIRRFKKGDKVLVITSPPTLPFPAAFVSLIKGASYTLFIRAHYPDHLLANGTLKPNSFLIRAILFANAWLFKYAARIIVVGRDTAELIRARTSGLDVPISTIPNWGGSVSE